MRSEQLTLTGEGGESSDSLQHMPVFVLSSSPSSFPSSPESMVLLYSKTIITYILTQILMEPEVKKGIFE